eukprot:7381675-Prymnesium_polylepis.1
MVQLLVDLTVLHAAPYAPPEPKRAEQPTSQQPISPLQSALPIAPPRSAPERDFDAFLNVNPRDIIATEEELDEQYEAGRQLEGTPRAA